MLFLKDAEHLGLAAQGQQLAGILRVGKAQEQAVREGLYLEQVDLSRTDKEGTIEVVHRVAQRVIGRIKFPKAFQEERLVLQPVFAEQADGLLGMRRDAVVGDVVVHNLLHLRAQGVHDLCRHALWQSPDAAVVAVCHGRVYLQGSLGVEFAHGLVEDEEERARIGAHAGGGRDVKELHVLVAEKRVVQAFHLVVHLRAGAAVGHVELYHVVEVLQREAYGDLVRLACVRTLDVYRFEHLYLLFFLSSQEEIHGFAEYHGTAQPKDCAICGADTYDLGNEREPRVPDTLQEVCGEKA